MHSQKQLVKIFESLKPEGVDITPSCDMSTIEAIRAHWRWPGVPPTDEEVAAAWDAIKTKVADADVSEARRKEYLKAGLTSEAMVVALWEKIMEERPDAATIMQATRETIKTANPKPIK
jgi:hypothetical protein